MPVVINLCGIVFVLTISKLTPRTSYLLTKSAISSCTQVEALIADIEREAHCDIRMRIANIGLIICIDNTITIDINKLQVTRLDTCTLKRVSGIALAVLVKVSLNVCLILHNTFCLVTIETSNSMSLPHTSHITSILSQEILTTLNEVGITLNLCHLILIDSHIPVQAISEVLTHFIIPIKCKLHTLVLYSTSVYPLSTETRNSISLDINQEVFGLLTIPVCSKAQATMQETGIDTNVQLL